MDAAILQQADLVIHTGDVFDRPHPGSRALIAAAEPMLRVACAGIPMIIVPGNHERSKMPTNLFLAHENIHILNRPKTLNFDISGLQVAVSGFPCLRREAHLHFNDAVAATRYNRRQADLRLLAVHEAFDFATCGPGNYRFRSGEGVVDRAWVPEDFHYVAAGHIHRHQVLYRADGGGPPIVYAGSPDRVSFAEQDEPKGYTLVQWHEGTLTHKFVEHGVRPMVSLPIDVSGMSRDQVHCRFRRLVEGLPKNAMAQICMSGAIRRSAIVGQRFTPVAREIRPDVILAVAAQAIEYLPDSVAARPSQRFVCAFNHLDAPETEVLEATRATVKEVPADRGVYALYDAVKRLLYVGKATSLRARVCSHLRGRQETNFYKGWTAQIAYVRVRRTRSDLESLLMEADLIGKLRPPFNRQMRKWKSYCYLRDTGAPLHRLEVCTEPPKRGMAFGPYRGRRFASDVAEAVACRFGLAHECPDSYFKETNRGNRFVVLFPDAPGAHLCDRYFGGRCAGVCGMKIATSDYEMRIARRNALLAGEDESAVLASERELESDKAKFAADVSVFHSDHFRRLQRTANTLRQAYLHGWLLSRARCLLGSTIQLPGEGQRAKCVRLSVDGIVFAWANGKAVGNLGACDAQRNGTNARWMGCIPRSMVDPLCIAAQTLHRDRQSYRVLDC